MESKIKYYRIYNIVFMDAKHIRLYMLRFNQIPFRLQHRL